MSAPDSHLTSCSGILKSQCKSILKNQTVFSVSFSDKLVKNNCFNFPAFFQILRVYREKFSMVNRQDFPYKANCATPELQASINTAWNFLLFV